MRTTRARHMRSFHSCQLRGYEETHTSLSQDGAASCTRAHRRPGSRNLRVHSVNDVRATWRGLMRRSRSKRCRGNPQRYPLWARMPE